ncbi:ribosomal protein L14-domain-containing protein [Pyronema omphalodes]|nr:ribosomal protein L14-domain-containing protein [Pyronema omphalodes]
MSCELKASPWRNVEVGRLVLLNDGASAGKIAVIVQIIDHKRVLIDAPEVPRQSFPLAHLSLTSITVNIPLGARTATVAKVWEKQEINDKWAKSALAKRIDITQKRAALTDFERFKVMVLKKQRRFEVKKAFAKAKKASA